MKSRITTLLAVLLLAVGSASAQEKTTIDDLILDLEVSAGTRYHGLQQANGAIDVGYCLFDRVYPYFRYESSLMLYKHEGSKTYGNTSNIGGGLGVVLLQWDDEDKKGNKEQIRFEFTGNVTTSVGRDYKNTVLPTRSTSRSPRRSTRSIRLTTFPSSSVAPSRKPSGSRGAT